MLTAVLKLKALGESASDSIPLGFEGMVEAWHCGSKDYRTHERWITLLIEAILRKRRCQVEYNTPGRTTPKRYDFDPYCLLLVGGGLYVVGHVPKHTGVATLAVDRLVSMAVSETPFEIDSRFDLQKCRQDAFGVSWSDPMEVVLHFRAEQAPYVRERVWHPSQQITDLPDGGVRLTFRAGGLFEIRRWILGWGDAVEVIGPESLRDDIRKALQSALLAYGSDHGIDGPALG